MANLSIPVGSTPLYPKGTTKVSALKVWMLATHATKSMIDGVAQVNAEILAGHKDGTAVKDAIGGTSHLVRGTNAAVTKATKYAAHQSSWCPHVSSNVGVSCMSVLCTSAIPAWCATVNM